MQAARSVVRCAPFVHPCNVSSMAGGSESRVCKHDTDSLHPSARSLPHWRDRSDLPRVCVAAVAECRANPNNAERAKWVSGVKGAEM